MVSIDVLSNVFSMLEVQPESSRRALVCGFVSLIMPLPTSEIQTGDDKD